MRAALLAVVAVITGGCTSGPPPGFSGGQGDRWTFPLVGPIEDDVLLAPVSIAGRGPYLFAIDPDANVSIIDESLVRKLDLRIGKGPSRLDETDTQQTRFYAEILQLELGTLIVTQQQMMVTGTSSFDMNGRRIMGVIGRDILADSLVFGFDREHGLGYLTTVKAFTPPPGATKLAWSQLNSRVQNAEVVPMPRRLVDATIGDAKLHMHLDLGAPHSELRESAWASAKLDAKPTKTATIDEAGTAHRKEALAIAPSVTVGALTAENVTFLPFADKRWPSEEIDGTLGLDFLRGYSTWVDWDAKAFYLVPRTPVSAKERIARWEDDVPAFGKCATAGCVKVRTIDPMAGKTLEEGKPHPGVVLVVERDPVAIGVDLEIVLEAKDRPASPRVLVALPASASRAMQQLKGDFIGATLEVVDASPYPRACPGAACVDLLARP
ncbi:MAG: retropepsin-like aspartic protease [Kofleriaceae bacterium]